MAKGIDGLEVNVGDSIVVSALGLTVRGVVAVVEYWGKDYGWDIEIDKANVQGGYSRWKQGTDGGHIVSINGKEVRNDG